MKKRLLSLLLSVVLLLGLLAACGEKAPSAETPTSPVQAPPSFSQPPSPSASESATPDAAPWENNVLMADKLDTSLPAGHGYESAVFGSDITRDEIATITVLDSLKDLPSAATWDVSETQNGSVLACVLKDGEYYDLFIAAEGGVSAPKDCGQLFSYYRNLKYVHFRGAFHTENTTVMAGMFNHAENLISVDVDGLNLSQITDINGMFNSCKKLTSLDVRNWDLGRVVYMRNMFKNCSSLTDLNVSRWDVSSVTRMNDMFAGCTALTALALSEWDVSSVKDMRRMFQDCRNLTDLDISSWDLSQVEHTEDMFDGCKINPLAPPPTAAPSSTPSATPSQRPSSSPSGTASTQKPSNTPSSTAPTQKPSSTPAQTVQVAKPLSNANQIPSGAILPDLAFFAGDTMKFGNTEADKSKTLSREIKYQLDDYKILEAYVAMLIREYDFELVETPYYKQYNNSGGKQTYFDFLLKYTGPKKLTGDQAEGFSGAKGDVRIYGAASYSSVKGSFIYNNGLTTFDDGQRYGSANVGTALAGGSAAAGLNRLPDGTYQTSDRRLRTAVGQAAVLSGSTCKTYIARYEEISGKRQSIFVEDQSGTVLLRLRFSSPDLLKAGALLTGADLADDNPFVLDRGTHDSNRPLDTTKFYVLHNKLYYSALPGLSGEIERVNVRVMYWEKGKTAVLHVGIRYESAPQEEEYLIAVSMGPETQHTEGSSGSGSSDNVPDPGPSATTPRIRCTYSGCEDGEEECSVCDGDGGWREYDDSTPGYGTGSGSWDWKQCSNCHGDGMVPCHRCGGDGWMD